MTMQFITLNHAAQLYKLDYSHLINMCHSAKIELHILKPSEDLIMSEFALLEILPIYQQPEYQPHAWMAGKGIGIREAAQKYGIAHQTICRWVAAGWLPVIAQDGRKKLVDQAIMAYAADIYKNCDGGQGRWVFNSEGVPYRKK